MEKELSWSAFEYKQKVHTVDWYWTVGLITVVVVVACIFFKNYLFAFLLLMGIGTLTYLSFRAPEEVSIVIDDKGIRVRNNLFTYRNLKGFWIEEEAQENGDRHLLILTSRTYSPLLALPLGDVAPETIRQALLPHLKEQEMHESVSHKFLEILGF